jgi:mannose-6-phosphate isomerase
MLETRFHRSLPDSSNPYGESWEISARPEADSKVITGPFTGMTLTQLWTDPEKRSLIFGDDAPAEDAFPLLFKILDAKEKLSIQVHPPLAQARELGGEPKTECWYIAHAEDGAELYVGVRRGVDEAALRSALENGTAESCVHAISVTTGQHIFIPSGRLHAIGSGILIYEIQQNSDTTYRVYDWNRVGIDGKPRQLHIEESLKCIDFTDVEPQMDPDSGTVLAKCDHFRLEKHPLSSGESLQAKTTDRFAVITMVSGTISDGETSFSEGDFFLVPAMAKTDALKAGSEGAEFLLTTWP